MSIPVTPDVNEFAASEPTDEEIEALQKELEADSLETDGFWADDYRIEDFDPSEYDYTDPYDIEYDVP